MTGLTVFLVPLQKFRSVALGFEGLSGRVMRLRGKKGYKNEPGI